MLRHSFALGALLAVTMLAANGCQCCSSCHDYDPPVANCHCGECGCNSGCSTCGCSGGCSNCGSNSGCSSCNGGAMMQPTETSEGTPTQSQVMMQQNNMQSASRPAYGNR